MIRLLEVNRTEEGGETLVLSSEDFHIHCFLPPKDSAYPKVLYLLVVRRQDLHFCSRQTLRPGFSFLLVSEWFKNKVDNLPCINVEFMFSSHLEFLKQFTCAVSLFFHIIVKSQE
jgi:hypothetical protein